MTPKTSDFIVNSKSKNQLGMGIVSTIIGAGIIAIGIVALVNLVKTSQETLRHAEAISEKLAIRNYIRENFDCNDALDKVAANKNLCATGTPFTVKKNNGKNFSTADTQTKAGNYRLKVFCDPTSKNIMIQTLRMAKKGNQVAIDTRNNTKATWEDPFDGIPPMTSSAQKTAYLDFESVPGAADGAVVDAAMNDYFEAQYGVRFNYLGGASLRLARIVPQGGPKVKFQAWLSAKCPKKPNNNRICGTSKAQAIAGNYALSSSNAKSSKTIKFEVVYSKPAKNPSFFIYDFDGKETWRIEAFDAAGNSVGLTQHSAGKGYSTGGTGNSDIMETSVTTSAPVKRLEFTGNKNIKIFGFGFDNFRTGVSSCSMTSE
jgi:hypothetical protein